MSTTDYNATFTLHDTLAGRGEDAVDVADLLIDSYQSYHPAVAGPSEGDRYELVITFPAHSEQQAAETAARLATRLHPTFRLMEGPVVQTTEEFDAEVAAL